MPPPTAEQRQQRLLRMLLARAQLALHKDQLMTPANDNAYGWYLQVLSHDGSNAEAHWGMREIGDRYLELAEQAFVSGNDNKAEVFLSRAQRISVTPAIAAQLRGKYTTKAPPENEFPLERRALSAKSDAIIAQLVEIAVLAREQSSRLTIYARTDAEGRWIYKQMRNAVNGYRLRGNIQLSKVPRVVLIDLNG